jgi:predicted dehydrogenase
VHFIDTFRYFLGEVTTVLARTRRANPVIAGEDVAQLFLTFDTGATAIWDANRYNEVEATSPRLTFGRLRVDATGGHATLDTEGRLRVKPLGQPAEDVAYAWNRQGFAGDSVYSLQRHFVECMATGEPFESSGTAYLRNVEVVEAAYESAQHATVVRLSRAP